MEAEKARPSHVPALAAGDIILDSHPAGHNCHSDRVSPKYSQRLIQFSTRVGIRSSDSVNEEKGKLGYNAISKHLGLLGRIELE